MAYIKIFPIKSTMKRVVTYVTDPAKTDEKLLISSYQCAPETADIEFAVTQKQGKQNLRDAGKNLGWHLIQSFKPGEITDPAKAHELGIQFADAVLKGRYQYVITTHIDKGHCHNHIVFCATSFKDYHMYQSGKKNIYKLCRTSNRICRENGLSESLPSGTKGRTYKENMEYKAGNSWKAKLRFQVDRAIWSSVNMDEFLMKMEQAGYEIRKGKYLAFRAPRQKHFTNVKTLGAFYSEENIWNRLERNRHRAAQPKIISAEIRMFIEIGNFVAADDRPGFEDWAELHNLQEAAKTFNYLSTNNLLNYEDFQNHVSDLAASITATETEIQEIDRQIEIQHEIQRLCEVYRHCRDVVTAEKSAKNKKAYQDQHEAEYDLHDRTMQELQALGITRIPSPEKIQKQLNALEEEKARVTKELQSQKKQQKTLQTVQANMQALLNGKALQKAIAQTDKEFQVL